MKLNKCDNDPRQVTPKEHFSISTIAPSGHGKRHIKRQFCPLHFAGLQGDSAYCGINRIGIAQLIILFLLLC